MIIEDWLKQATKTLEQHHIPTARLDCLVLLEDCVQNDRSLLLAHSELKISNAQIKVLDTQIKRRAGHEPLSYIRGKTEFYGREFIINKHVLEPRPESETMIDILLALVKGQKSKVKSIIDIGTGSGALAITAKLEWENIKILATDIDKDCIKTALQNAKKLGADVKFHQGDLLQPLLSTVYRLPTALLCNLPYVPDSHSINQAAGREPRLAIFGGPDGLDIYRRLFAQTRTLLDQPAFILTESLPFQHMELKKIAQQHGYSQQIEHDLIQLFTYLN